MVEEKKGTVTIRNREEKKRRLWGTIAEGEGERGGGRGGIGQTWKRGSEKGVGERGER